MTRFVPLMLLVAVSVLITACAAQVTTAGGRTVIVRSGFPDMGLENALVLAQMECEKVGLAARVQSVTSATTDRYIFECLRLGS
jgi:hypothetical protein